MALLTGNNSMAYRTGKRERVPHDYESVTFSLLISWSTSEFPVNAVSWLQVLIPEPAKSN